MESNQLPSGAPITPGVSLGEHITPGARLSHQGDAPGEGSSGDWRRYATALWRYRWLVLAVTVVGGGAGFVVARSIPPLYMAQATIWIEQDERGGRGPIREDPMLTESGWTDLLKSYAVLDEVIRETRRYLSVKSNEDVGAFDTFRLSAKFRPGSYKLKVGDDGRTFVLATADGAVVQQGAVGDSIGGSLGFLWQPTREALAAGKTIQFGVVPPRDAALVLTERLRTRADPRGSFMMIELEETDPVLTAATLNSLAHHYVAIAGDLKRNKLNELTVILGDQLRQAEGNLKDAESALETFRVRTITLPSERSLPVAPGLEVTRDAAVTGFFDLKVEREQLRRDREAIERALAANNDSLLSVGLGVVATVQQAPELQQALQELTVKQADLRGLLSRYTSEHQPVKRLQGDVEALRSITIPSLARRVATELAVRERELDSRIGTATVDLKQIPPRAIEEARLRRAVSVAENLYTTLQQRYEEARLAAASTIPDVRVLDNAVVPERPSQDNSPRILLMAILGSLGVAVVGAVLMDRMDSRFFYPEQVSMGLGLPILGSVPRVPKSEGGPRDAAAVVEALRGIRLGVLHAHGAAGPCVFTVTSPGAGDGKSLVAANLAVAFADAGYQTLLVDGDLRRGTLHKLLGGERKPGLSDCLAGLAEQDQIVQPTKHDGLKFIACGTWMQRAPELLGSAGMGRIVSSMRSSYSVIIVDSPPLSAGVDPLVLGTATGNLVVVLRTGVTDRELAAAKLDIVDTLPIRVLGAVLNDVRATGVYRYYAYASGYELRDEASVRETPKIGKGQKA